MGQAMTSETLSISGVDGFNYWVGLQAKPCSRGCKKCIYKGVLLGSGPRQWEKVVAKSFTNIPGTKDSWAHEVKKADVTKEMALKFSENSPSEFKISVVIPGLVQMDKVSKINKWLDHRHGRRTLTKDDWISIEEFIPGSVYRFCPWSDNPGSDTNDVRESDHLQTFSHFTYKQSDGEMVACDFQGIKEDDTYIFTDSIIHSRQFTYGHFDEGEHGIMEFFKRHKCTNVCKDWPVPKPTTPSPPPSVVLDDDDTRKHVRFDLTPFENVVFPSQRLMVKKRKKKGRTPSQRRKSDHGISKPQAKEQSRQIMSREEREYYRRIYPQLPSFDEEGPPSYEERKSPGSSVTAPLDRGIILDEAGSSCDSSQKQKTCSPTEGKLKSCLKRTNSDRREFFRATDLELPTISSNTNAAPSDSSSSSFKTDNSNQTQDIQNVQIPDNGTAKNVHQEQHNPNLASSTYSVSHFDTKDQNNSESKELKSPKFREGHNPMQYYVPPGGFWHGTSSENWNQQSSLQDYGSFSPFHMPRIEPSAPDFSDDEQCQEDSSKSQDN